MNDINGFLKRRWPAMIASLLICICAGFGYAWSVLQTPIIAAHGWPDQQVSLTYTVTVLCSTMAPLFFGGSAVWVPGAAWWWAPFCSGRA